MDLSKMLEGVKPTEGNDYSLLKKGEYVVMIEKITTRENDNGWKALNFQLRVVDGERKNAVIFDQITVAHSTSSEAVEIGKSKIKNICICVESENTEKMINKRLRAHVGVKHNSYKNEDENIVYNYGKLEDTKIGADFKLKDNKKNAFSTDDIPF